MAPELQTAMPIIIQAVTMRFWNEPVLLAFMAPHAPRSSPGSEQSSRFESLRSGVDGVSAEQTETLEKKSFFLQAKITKQFFKKLKILRWLSFETEPLARQRMSDSQERSMQHLSGCCSAHFRPQCLVLH